MTMTSPTPVQHSHHYKPQVTKETIVVKLPDTVKLPQDYATEQKFHCIKIKHLPQTTIAEIDRGPIGQTIRKYKRLYSQRDVDGAYAYLERYKQGLPAQNDLLVPFAYTLAWNDGTLEINFYLSSAHTHGFCRYDALNPANYHSLSLHEANNYLGDIVDNIVYDIQCHFHLT